MTEAYIREEAEDESGNTEWADDDEEDMEEYRMATGTIKVLKNNGNNHRRPQAKLKMLHGIGMDYDYENRHLLDQWEQVWEKEYRAKSRQKTQAAIMRQAEEPYEAVRRIQV